MEKIRQIKRLRQVKLVYSIFAICLIILGTFLVFRSEINDRMFYQICGVLLIFLGIVKLMGYFSRDILQLAFQYDFAMGNISLLIGLMMLLRSKTYMETLIIGIGLFILVDALLRIQTAFDAKRIGVDKWWNILIIALITAIIAAVLFLKPYKGIQSVVMLIGMNLIIDGVLNFIVVQSTVDTIRRKREWEI